jgi:hypothetical protein
MPLVPNQVVVALVHETLYCCARRVRSPAELTCWACHADYWVKCPNEHFLSVFRLGLQPIGQTASHRCSYLAYVGKLGGDYSYQPGLALDMVASPKSVVRVVALGSGRRLPGLLSIYAMQAREAAPRCKAGCLCRSEGLSIAPWLNVV